jgi:hypothetical protein
MKRIKKPDPLAPKGWWENPDYIPPALKSELRILLPRRMSADAATNFLNQCSAAVQTALEIAPKTSTGKTVSELNRVADRAHALLKALSAMSWDTRSVLGTHTDALTFLTNPPERLSPLCFSLLRPDLSPGWHLYARKDGFFLGVWDLIADLEIGARYSASQCTPSRQSKLSVNTARTLVRQVSSAYQRVTGKLPPSNKETWFPPFVEKLGRHYNLPCGLKVTRRVIREMKALPLNSRMQNQRE